MGVLGTRRDGAELAQHSEARCEQHEVVGELMEAALDAEVGREREREDEGVRRHVAARMVTHEQHRARRRDPLEVAYLGPEVDAGEQPEPGELITDVVGVALVHVRRGYARFQLAGSPRPGFAPERANVRQRAHATDRFEAGFARTFAFWLSRPDRPAATGLSAQAPRPLRNSRTNPQVRSGCSKCGTWPQDSSTTDLAAGTACST